MDTFYNQILGTTLSVATGFFAWFLKSFKIGQAGASLSDGLGSKNSYAIQRPNFQTEQ